MSRILHAALAPDWAAALEAGSYAVSSRGRTLADEGFIHASTRAQLSGVLDGFYADVAEVVLLVLDVEALDAAGSPVRWDEVPGAPGPFPHIYGVVPTTVVGEANPVVAAITVRRPGSSGGSAEPPPWELPDLTAYDLAPSPPG